MELLRRKARRFVQHRPIFQPLDEGKREIRLLHLRPRNRTRELLDCTLETVSLNSHSFYETISYTWGAQTTQRKIRLNGHDCSIPSSALDALQALQFPDMERILWIDAVCINQADDTERGQQVALMRDVYRQARRTWVHLNGNNSSPSATFLSIKTLAQQTRKDKTPNRVLNHETNLDAQDHETMNGTSLPPQCEKEALIDFYNLPWFRRLWVVQEVALSREVWCIWCNQCIAWRDIAAAASWLFHAFPQQHGTSRLNCVGIDNVTIMQQYCNKLANAGSVEYPSLGNLLANGRHFKATEPKDKVFAMLGMTDSRLSFKPDYQQDLVAVYARATRAAIEETQSLHVFRYVFSRNLNDADMGGHRFPSWVPRWDLRAQPGHARPLPKLLDCCGKTNIQVHESDDVRVLKLDGIVLDEISSVSHVIRDIDLSAEGFVKLYEVFTTMVKASSLPGSNQALFSIFELTITADNPVGWSHLPDQDVAVDKCTEPVHKPHSSKEIDYGLRRMVNTRAKRMSLTSISMNRRLFVSRNGMIGLAPSTAGPGAIVTKLYGGSIPFILRVPSSGTKYFELLGESYVHGGLFVNAEHGETTRIFNIM